MVPETAIVPDRAAPELGSTLTVTEPLPEPPAGPVTLIQDTKLVALQAHADPVATVVVSVPPAAATVAALGLRLIWQGRVCAGCAAWSTDKVPPPRVTSPWRAVPVL